MFVLEMIGWAFIAGCMVGAFVMPVAFVIWLFSQPETESK